MTELKDFIEEWDMSRHFGFELDDDAASFSVLQLPLATSDWRDHCVGFREAYTDILDARYLSTVEAGMDTSEIRAAVDAIGEFRLFMEIVLYTEFIEYVAKDAPEKWARLAKEVLRSKGE